MNAFECPGKDYLILVDSLDDLDIQIYPCLEGFDLRPLGRLTLPRHFARVVDIVQGADFTWKLRVGSVMSSPDSRDIVNNQVIKYYLNVLVTRRFFKQRSWLHGHY